MKEIRDDLSVCLSTGQLQTNDDESKTNLYQHGNRVQSDGVRIRMLTILRLVSVK